MVDEVDAHRRRFCGCCVLEDSPQCVGAALRLGTGEMAGVGVVAVLGPGLVPVGQTLSVGIGPEDVVESTHPEKRRTTR